MAITEWSFPWLYSWVWNQQFKNFPAFCFSNFQKVCNKKLQKSTRKSGIADVYWWKLFSLLRMNSFIILLQTVLFHWLKPPPACKWEPVFLWDAISAPHPPALTKMHEATKIYEPSELHAEGLDIGLEQEDFKALFSASSLIMINLFIQHLLKNSSPSNVLVPLLLGHWLARRPTHPAPVALQKTDPKQWSKESRRAKNQENKEDKDHRNPSNFKMQWMH